MRRIVYRNELFFFLLFLYLTGVLTGSIILRRWGEGAQFAGELLAGVVGSREQMTLWESCLSSFLGALLPLGVLFFSGLCAAGQPFICLTEWLRGLGYGYFVGGMYRLWAEHGSAAFLLQTVPNGILTAWILLRAGQTSLRFSCRILSAIKTSSAVPIQPFVLEYGGCILLLLLLSVLNGLLGQVLSAF